MAMQRLTLPVAGMTCAGCALTIERVLRQHDGVVTASANFIDRRVTVTYDPTKVERDTLIRTVQRLGYKVLVKEKEYVK